MPSIILRHNIEVAHRMYEMPGKCQQIHGHSMWVEMQLFGKLNPQGVLEGLEFSIVKKRFRAWLDGTFDHHLLLNENDPWAQKLRTMPGDKPIGSEEYLFGAQLPGLMAMPCDPTTENIAKWIAEWAVQEWRLTVEVVVHETAVNAASYIIGSDQLIGAEIFHQTTGEHASFTTPQGGREHLSTSKE